jgi:hypothetical protein
VTPGPLVVQTEERDDVSDVGVAVDEAAHPSGVRMNVMRLCTTVADELVANEERERQVRQTTAVQVSEFAMAAAKLGAAESMPPDGHTRPRRDFADDGVVDGVGHGITY